MITSYVIIIGVEFNPRTEKRNQLDLWWQGESSKQRQFLMCLICVSLSKYSKLL